MRGDGVFDETRTAAPRVFTRHSAKSFEELADEAFADLLKKHKQPVGLKAALKESVGQRQQPHRSTKK